ncbi:UbiA prenyltransferase family protein [Mesonia aquimarina]|uniref:hypothetical protein n=1 Tax=Mesonia aquimarina TaxID=1504967 RepID=UPI000EF59372|nr:hypothetical protein [Mesonia aquimarina]
MSKLKKTLIFYINSSIHVAFAIAALAWISFLELNIPVDFTILCFIFLSSITGYNFVKYAGIAKLHHQSLTKNLRIIQLFSFACFLVLIYFSSLQTLDVIWVTSILGIFTFFYTVPFLPDRTNLRSLRSLKIFVIALVWAGTTVLLPVVNFQEVFNSEIVLLFLQRFLFVVALTIPFEIRDVVFDRANLGTLPQLTGTEQSKKIGYVLLFLFLGIDFFLADNFISTIPEILTVIILAVSIYKSSTSQNRYFSAFWVEGIPLLWLFFEFLL